MRALAVLGCGDGGISTRRFSTVVMFSSETDFVALGVIQVERKISPLEERVGRLANDHRRLRRRGRRTQTVAQLGENRVAVLHPQAFRHVHRHGQRGETVVENHRRPDDFDINEAPVLAAMPPDASAGRRSSGVAGLVPARPSPAAGGPQWSWPGIPCGNNRNAGWPPR